jgi:hypothetical protein
MESNPSLEKLHEIGMPSHVATTVKTPEIAG